LQKEGYDVIIADDFSNSEAGVLDRIFQITGKKAEFVNIDLTDEGKVIEFIKERTEICKVIHFAAFKAVEESVKFPLKYYRNNLYSLINLLSAFSDRKIDFVFSSSCTVYGQPDHLPVSEQSCVKKAESPYGNTKQIAEEILEETASANSDFRCIALRYFNPAGAHPSGLIGELPSGVPQNLVPFVTQSAIGKRGSIVVYGNDYDTWDGSCVRDFIHVVDLAKAHVAALKHMDHNEGLKYEVFNIGTGNGSSVLELIKTFESVTGVRLRYEIGSRRSGDIVKIFGGVSKANDVLGWKAQYGLKEMMDTAWKWEVSLDKKAISNQS